jgi:phage-related protein
MPGSVANAVIPTVSGHPLVFPFALSTAFTETQSVAARVNEYHDGTTQRMATVATVRRSWKLTERLTPAAMATLRAFMLAYPTTAFYFYNPKEPGTGQVEGSNYDATGSSPTGRYTVRLAGDLTEQSYIPRTDVGVDLVEIA